MRRRRYLAVLGTATIGGLAGCSGGNGGGEGTTGTDAGTTSTTTATGTTTESTTATTTRTETETRTATETETETGTATATESTAGTTGETTTGSSGETTAEGTASGDVRTVEVGPGNRYVFEPGTNSPLEIPVGTTVEWVWRSNTHNVVVSEQPSGAGWEGTPGGTEELYNSGYTYTHTFETAGEYSYYCSPHQSLGMVADVVVTDSR